MKWQIGYGSEFRATAILTHDFNHLEKVIGEMLLFWGCFGHFEALIGAHGVTDVRRGLPGCS